MHINEIRREMRFYTELVQLVETLKNIAAAQYHAMERQKQRFQEFLDAFAGFFRVVDLAGVSHPLVRTESPVLGLVVVTSDSGFMGGLNQGVIRTALQVQGTRPDAEVSLVVIGDKGATAFSDMGRTFRFFRGIVQERLYEAALEVRDYLVAEVQERRMGRVVVVYPRPISFTAQTVERLDLLPCGELFDRAAPSEVAEHWRGTRLVAEARRVIVESSFEAMVEYLARTWVGSKLYEIFEDSKLAEFSARAVHLEGSHQKVQKELQKIRHLYFKAAHEKIDKGMRETFAASKKRRSSPAA